MPLPRRAAPQRAPREGGRTRLSTGAPLRCRPPPAPDPTGQLASCAAAAQPRVAIKRALGYAGRRPAPPTAAAALSSYSRPLSPPLRRPLTRTHAHPAAACASIQTPRVPPVQRSKGRAADSTPHTRGTLTACLSVHAALAATTLLLEKEGEWERALLLAPRQLLATRPAAHPRFAAVLSRLDASHSWLGQDAIARVGDEPREEDTRGGGRAHRRHGVLEARFSQPVGFSTAALAGLLLSACAARTAAIATEDSRRRSWLSPSSPARRSSMLALASYFRLGALRSERLTAASLWLWRAFATNGRRHRLFGRS